MSAAGQSANVRWKVGLCAALISICGVGFGAEPHWAFTAPGKAPLPAVSDQAWPRGATDRFILARLEAEGLTPNPEADPHTLLRRLSFDLVGLPPSPEEVSQFVQAFGRNPDAVWTAAIDRLLSSPHFGEKWARWWMDLAHYADTDGYTVDYDRPHAWRWRDWVVNAFNRNQPFDQFTIEQVAGDLLPGATIDQKIATGFFRHTLSNREGGADLEEHRVKKVIDRTATYGATWLGLTIECAQCHEHKFDPISHREYYELYAFFNNADEVNIDAPLPGERERFDEALKEYRRRWQETVQPVAAKLDPTMRKWEQLMLDAEREPGVDYKRDRALELLGILWGAGQGEGQLEGIRITRIPPHERSQRDRERLLEYFVKRGRLGLETEFKELDKTALRKTIGELAGTLPALSRPQTMQAALFPRETRVFDRGDFRTPKESVSTGIPAFLPRLKKPDPTRLDLARWTVSPDNPLTARVLVNRIWQEMFGRALVTTPEDFGLKSAKPSHPGLLDWLAVDFMESGWDLKRLIRQLAMTATYRQSSEVSPETRTRDPDNELLARAARNRLSAEIVRDAALFVSGLWEPRIGGPSVRPLQPESVTAEASYNATWKASEGGDRYRRGLYTWIQRVTPYAQFATFDLPNVNRACARRDRSNTPLQSLTLLNDPVFTEAAAQLAKRVRRETAGASAPDQLAHAFLLCLGRPGKPAELARLESFWREQNAAKGAEHAWNAAAVVLLNLDEFITRE